jgi:hypothetical protein
MILADTSVWISHFRSPHLHLQTLLSAELVLMHPFVIGEISCGNLPRRGEALGWLRRLPLVPMAGNQEVMELIERRRLWGRGIGWVDAHLLASALLTRCRLWSFDQQLQAAAHFLNIDYRQALV